MLNSLTHVISGVADEVPIAAKDDVLEHRSVFVNCCVIMLNKQVLDECRVTRDVAVYNEHICRLDFARDRCQRFAKTRDDDQRAAITG